MGWQLVAEKSAYSLAVGLALVVGVGCTASDEAPRTPNGMVAGAGVGGGGLGTGGVAGPIMTPPGSTPIPCNVQLAVQATCGKCHGAATIGGAPMSLVTHENWTNPAYVVKTTTDMIGQTVKANELARIRLNSVAAPMPPGMVIEPAQKATIDAWLAAGAVAGTDADRNCVIMPPVGGTGGMVVGGTGGAPGTGGMGGTLADEETIGPDGFPYLPENYSMEPLVPRPELGEICYDLLVHGGQTLPDTTKFNVPVKETYEQFYYNVPWTAGEVGARFGAKFDNVAVLHHWLLFTTAQANLAGSHATSVGTQLGDTNSKLLAGWAIGGSRMAFPSDVGLKLPKPGEKVLVQWHLYNSTGALAPDGTAVQVCTVPAASRKFSAGITWLGTETLGLGLPASMGPGISKPTGTCLNDSGADITIISFWPHMHRIGRNMESTVNGVTVFNKPFDPNLQIYYNQKPRLVLHAGEKITSTCTFDNQTGHNVGFGTSTDQEMCYQFAYSYPAGALDNGILSLIGTSNTCWGN